ncbi:hypothetical protein [Bradyrhizobium elkanii]|uniref:hypothetical protein n=1 Tax=Bradyrhizobium elkanii TaxID=29448 RepID=UPI00114CBC2D|nr:hypothetical protein [Bradyrhizobium elkanii]
MQSKINPSNFTNARQKICKRFDGQALAAPSGLFARLPCCERLRTHYPAQFGAASELRTHQILVFKLFCHETTCPLGPLKKCEQAFQNPIWMQFAANLRGRPALLEVSALNINVEPARGCLHHT